MQSLASPPGLMLSEWPLTPLVWIASEGPLSLLTLCMPLPGYCLQHLIISKNALYTFCSVFIWRFFELLVAASPGHWGVAPPKRLIRPTTREGGGPLERAKSIHVLFACLSNSFPKSRGAASENVC